MFDRIVLLSFSILSTQAFSFQEHDPWVDNWLDGIPRHVPGNLHEIDDMRAYQSPQKWLTENRRNGRCILFSEENYGGARFDMPDGLWVPRLGEHMISTRSWHGHLVGWKGRDRSWSGEVRSVTVPRFFTLELFTDEGFRGQRIIFKSVGSRDLLDFKGLIQSARCLFDGNEEYAAGSSKNSNDWTQL